MPKGPNGERRPANSVACAIAVAKIATGETQDDGYRIPGRKKSGLSGAKARTESLTPERRSQIAKKAASTRWR
jgi:hypothetical protein